MIGTGLATTDQAIFDLDFHAVMHWGGDPALEKHYVPTRSQRSRSVLTFFAQDSGAHNLIYANADISEATQNREVIAFADHWKAVSGHEPAMLVMDSKVTIHAVLGELDARGITFLTLRMRSAALIKQINALAPGDYKTITLDRPGPHNTPRVHETSAVKLSKYPGTVRQFIVTGLGREAPTVIITNDRDTKTTPLIERYARRMTIEQRLAEIIRAFHTDALSSAVNLNVDNYGDTTTVRLNCRAYSPVVKVVRLPVPRQLSASEDEHRQTSMRVRIIDLVLFKPVLQFLPYPGRPL